MKSKANKIIINLYRDGYCVVKNILTDAKYNKIIRSLENLSNIILIKTPQISEGGGRIRIFRLWRDGII